jgi:hypothetical protein
MILRKARTDSCSFGAPIRFGEHLHFRRRRDVEVEGDRDERQPRRQRRGARGHLGAQTLDDRSFGVVAAEMHELAQEFAPKRVRRRSGIGFAGGVKLAKSRRGVAKRFEEPALPEPRLAPDLDESPDARARAGVGLADDAQLGVAAGQRQLLHFGVALTRASRRTDRPGLHRIRLAFYREGLELVRFEERVATVEHVGRRVDVPTLGLGHQPC